jgi:hypothetical protein
VRTRPAESRRVVSRVLARRVMFVPFASVWTHWEDCVPEYGPPVTQGTVTVFGDMLIVTVADESLPEAGMPLNCAKAGRASASKGGGARACLEFLYVIPARTVVVRNHPRSAYIKGQQPRCPDLNSRFFHLADTNVPAAARILKAAMGTP